MDIEKTNKTAKVEYLSGTQVREDIHNNVMKLYYLEGRLVVHGSHYTIAYASGKWIKSTINQD